MQQGRKVSSPCTPPDMRRAIRRRYGQGKQFSFGTSLYLPLQGKPGAATAVEVWVALDEPARP